MQEHPAHILGLRLRKVLHVSWEDHICPSFLRAFFDTRGSQFKLKDTDIPRSLIERKHRFELELYIWYKSDFQFLSREWLCIVGGKYLNERFTSHVRFKSEIKRQKMVLLNVERMKFVANLACNDLNFPKLPRSTWIYRRILRIIFRIAKFGRNYTQSIYITEEKNETKLYNEDKNLK